MPFDHTHSSLIRDVSVPGSGERWPEFDAVYRPLIEAYVRKQGVAGEEVEDLVQAVLLRLLQALRAGQYQPERGRFRTWLWRVVQSAIGDWARARQRWQRAEQAERDRLLVLEQVAPEPEPEWLEEHHRRVLTVVLRQVQGETSPDSWASFEQYVLHQRPVAELAAELGNTANAIRVNAHRVLKLIRARCAGFEEELGHG